MPLTQLFDQDAPGLDGAHLLDRRLAAAHVGVTIGLFERLVREQVIPDPVVIDRKPLWNARLLDGSIEAIRRARDLQANEAVRPLGPSKSAATEPSTILPDLTWLQQREALVRRVQKRPLTQHELSALGEFNLTHGRETSVFGFYRTFESLMARGLVLEVSRSGPSSRPLVTYRLTEDGARIAACTRGSK